MSINVLGTGPYNYYSIGTKLDSNSISTYSFFSGLLTTTDSFEDNILDFGIRLSQFYIINAGLNMIAFQFPDQYITTLPPTPTNTASGIVLPNSSIYFQKTNKSGIKARSATTGSQSSFYVFGI